VLGPGGTIAKSLPGYESRPAQLQMAHVIERAIAESRRANFETGEGPIYAHVVAEAGTGTGKSLAYLVPAILSGQKVVVSTAVKALQDQLIKKDLPFLQEHMGVPFTYMLLKGRSNYVCKEFLGKSRQRVAKDEAVFDHQEDYALLEQLEEWLRTDEAEASDGDLEASGVRLTPGLREAVTSDSESCLGKTCPLYRECFVERAKAKSRMAQVVVVNHSLLLIDAKLREQGINLIPEADTLVVDECFPAGTLVDGQPIENIRPGDMVTAYNESSGALIPSRVLSVSKRSAPDRLLAIESGGRRIVATENHPFWTQRGWVAAKRLTCYDTVHHTDWSMYDEIGQPDNPTRIQAGAMQPLRPDIPCGVRSVPQIAGGEAGVLLLELCLSDQRAQKEEVARNDVPPVWSTISRDHRSETRDGARESCLLLCGVPVGHAPGGWQKGYGDRARAAHGQNQGAHAAAQPYGRPGGQGEDADFAQRSWLDIPSWWQRNWTDHSGAPFVVGTQLASAVGHYDARSKEGLSDLLQGGCGQPDPDGGNRDRWTESRHSKAEGHRRQEGRVATGARVDRIEVLQPGSDGTFGGVCPDGAVYNFEVEHYHTYVANGFVVHNCHRLTDVARDVLGEEVTETRLGRLISRLQKLTVKHPETMIGEHAEDYRNEAESWVREAGDILVPYNEIFHVLKERLEEADESQQVLGDEQELCAPAIAQLERFAYRMRGRAAVDDAASAAPKWLTGPDREAWAKLEAGFEKLARALTIVSAPEDADKWCRYAEAEGPRDRRRLTIQCKPIEVAEEMERMLNRAFPTVVFTSATLATGSDFTTFVEENGLTSDDFHVTTMVAPSPFPYERNALLYCPSTMPDPRVGLNEAAKRAYYDELARQIGDLLRISMGRAFCLFTSRSAMRETWARLSPILPTNWRLYNQDEHPRSVVVEAFKDKALVRSHPAVLFATRTFFEGVDIAGEHLELVILDKIPFPTAGDPLYKARCRAIDRKYGEGKSFERLTLPEAVKTAKQATGRLIRTNTDIGVCAILDVRLAKKSYGRTIVQALPPMRRTQNLHEVRALYARERSAV
jgi:Rad3-related DNA helicase